MFDDDVTLGYNPLLVANARLDADIAIGLVVVTRLLLYIDSREVLERSGRVLVYNVLDTANKLFDVDTTIGNNTLLVEKDRFDTVDKMGYISVTRLLAYVVLFEVLVRRGLIVIYMKLLRLVRLFEVVDVKGNKMLEVGNNTLLMSTPMLDA